MDYDSLRYDFTKENIEPWTKEWGPGTLHSFSFNHLASLSEQDKDRFVGQLRTLWMSFCRKKSVQQRVKEPIDLISLHILFLQELQRQYQLFHAQHPHHQEDEPQVPPPQEQHVPPANGDSHGALLPSQEASTVASPSPIKPFTGYCNLPPPPPNLRSLLF